MLIQTRMFLKVWCRGKKKQDGNEHADQETHSNCTENLTTREFVGLIAILYLTCKPMDVVHLSLVLHMQTKVIKVKAGEIKKKN